MEEVIEHQMQMWINTLIGLCALIVAALTFVSTLMMRSALVKEERNKAQATIDLNAALEKVRKDFLSVAETQSNRFGEVVSGLREHVNKEISSMRGDLHRADLHVRDFFLRKDSFYNSVKDLKDSFDDAMREIKEDIRRMEAVLENMRRDGDK